MKLEKHKCQERMWGGWHYHDCSNNAKVDRNGEWYCGIHDPVRCAEKAAIRQEKYDKESKIRNERYERQSLMSKIFKNKTTDELREMAKDK